VHMADSMLDMEAFRDLNCGAKEEKRSNSVDSQIVGGDLWVKAVCFPVSSLGTSQGCWAVTGTTAAFEWAESATCDLDTLEEKKKLPSEERERRVT
jgi:hypothetical protein